MIRHHCLAAALLLAATPAGAAEHDADRAAILAGEIAWSHAFVTGDPAPVRSLLADDFAGISPSGTHYGKAGALAEITGEHADTVTQEAHGITIRFFGETAIAQGQDHEVTKETGPRGIDIVWTDVWVRRAGVWRIVAAQDTFAPR